MSAGVLTLKHRNRGAVSIELVAVIPLFVIAMLFFINGARVHLAQLKIDRVAADLAALAADMPFANAPYDETLKERFGDLMKAANRMYSGDDAHLGLRIEWSQLSNNYQKQWKSWENGGSVVCEQLANTVFSTQNMKTRRNRSEAEFVQVELCAEFPRQYFGKFNFERYESRAIQVRRWWEV